ncbi:18414_t:CDS:2 [Racocetra fulgida]|uniref:18414_t:CDS:1 n=1 Tax=Racocetra fulgida TaxID=60492 RepID=A0A9N9FAL5_9GLOM|nr:18414_t:CDS:2 [Racocetra fulgida]
MIKYDHENLKARRGKQKKWNYSVSVSHIATKIISITNKL